MDTIRPFFQNQSTFFDFQKRAGESPLPPPPTSCVWMAYDAHGICVRNFRLSKHNNHFPVCAIKLVWCWSHKSWITICEI